MICSQQLEFDKCHVCVVSAGIPVVSSCGSSAVVHPSVVQRRSCSHSQGSSSIEGLCFDVTAAAGETRTTAESAVNVSELATELRSET